MGSKMGRPTDNPKPHRITIRLDEAGKKILDMYCEQEKVSQTDAIRRGVEKLNVDIKK